ncbi:anti-sigma factor [Nocardia sp. CA2R105]|uniref:anti-sigma factor n=1 Tax=Nocardia coffeae TaxID=2873381 RepID=UPI001CA6B9C9|nr:anti-sigma factor [Nocardia coffeae]MBY8857180.1 anti-sigma factor [Nocardia coffeae]
MSNNEPSRPTTVGIRVPAAAQQLTMLRALTETALLMADLVLDEVTDIQVAIDEVVTSVIAAARPGSTIECEVVFGDGRTRVCLTAVVIRQDVIDQQSFGWRVMQTVTESLQADLGAFDRMLGGYPVSVGFSRERRAIEP